MKVWITEYALTEGIVEAEADKPYSARVIVVRDGPYRGGYHKPDWHTSLEDARERAEEMRVNHIAALKEGIKRLEAFSFGAEKQGGDG